MVEAMNKVGSAKFENFDDYIKKYGLTEITEIVSILEGLGVLLNKNLIDVELVDSLFGPTLNVLWSRMIPVLDAMRKGLNEPYFFSNTEALVNRLNTYRKKKK